MRIFQVETKQEETKCGGCNWDSCLLYVMAETGEGAQYLFDRDEAGMCAGCVLEMICETHELVVVPRLADARRARGEETGHPGEGAVVTAGAVNVDRGSGELDGPWPGSGVAPPVLGSTLIAVPSRTTARPFG